MGAGFGRPPPVVGLGFRLGERLQQLIGLDRDSRVAVAARPVSR